MKLITPHFSLLTLLLTSHFSLLTCHAAVPLRWTVETSRLQPAVFDVVRGETLELEATFKSYGMPVETSNMTAFVCWQTNGMGSAWWVTNAVTTATVARALFTPSMDPGTPTVTAFMGLSSATNSSLLTSHSSLNYRAAFTLRYRHGPGATPNALDTPPRVLDLANTVVVNPPWPTQADLAATTNGLATASTVSSLASQVSAIGAYLNAEDAHFVSTNYDSSVRLPEAYVEIKMNGTWITIWREMTRWTRFVGDAFTWEGWGGLHTWMTNVTAELSYKADRCWGIYDSETGGLSPEGCTQISSSNILVAANMAFQKTVTSGGAVWVLQCNSGVAHVGGDTNGFFRISDLEGETQFEIVRGDKQELGADADGITVDNSTSPPTVTIPYSVEADEHPTLQVCDDLISAQWKAETDAGCVANVTWTGSSGAYVATVQRKTAGDKLFVKATYMSGGETYIRNVAPVGMDAIILNGTKFYLGTNVISGKLVLTLSTTPQNQ